jgi:hypothetical protein
VTPSPRSRVSPGLIVLLTLIMFVMFVMFWAQSTLLTALVVALATLTAGGLVLTLLFGTAWMALRHRGTAEPPRHHVPDPRTSPGPPDQRPRRKGQVAMWTHHRTQNNDQPSPP